MSEVLPDGTIVTKLDSWDPRTPHTEDRRWCFELADGSQLEFVGRVHTEVGTRAYSHQTAEQLADPDWRHHETGWCDGITGTVVGQTVTMRIVPGGNLYSLHRSAWVASARTVSITCRDTSQVPRRTTSDWWWCELEDGSQWIEESYARPEMGLEEDWDFTRPQGRYWRLDLFPRRPRSFFLSDIKQVGEVLGYVVRPLTAADCPETMPMEVELGTIVHSSAIEDPTRS